MRSLATICVVLLTALSITIAQVQAFDSTTDSEAEGSEVFQQEALGGSLNQSVSHGSTMKSIDDIQPTQSQIPDHVKLVAGKVWVLEEIYIADDSLYCGENTLPLPTYLDPLEPSPQTLKKKCKDEKSGLNMELTLEFSYPRRLSYENPGTFEGKASLTVTKENNNQDSWAALELELYEVFDPSDKCEKDEYVSKDFPAGQDVNETLKLSAKCDYLAMCKSVCQYSDAWWSGEEAMFGFEVDGSGGGISPSFYIWLTYKESVGPFLLSVSKGGDGSGTVKSNLPGIDCGEDCTQRYPLGTQVNLTAYPDPDSYISSLNLSRPNYEECNNNPCSIIMDQNKEFRAVFNKPELIVNVESLRGGKGTVTSSPKGINCNQDSEYEGEECKEFYAPGTHVALKANPDRGSKFYGWMNASFVDEHVCNNSKKEICIVTVKDKHVFMAIFEGKPLPLSAIEILLLGPETKKK
jgi:hypothetical protein